MTVRYSWSDTSLLSRIDIDKGINGTNIATVFASARANPEQLSAVVNALSANDIPVYFDHTEGQDTLVAANFGKEQQLLAVLRNAGVVTGSENRQIVEEGGQKHNWWGKLRSYGTNIAGALGVSGHAALIASGMIAKEQSRVMAGLQYGTSAGILAMYGSGTEKKVEKLCSGLQDYLSTEGVEFAPQNLLTPVSAFRTRSTLEKGGDALKENSILAANVIGVGGNLSMIQSGIDVGKREGFVAGFGRGMHGGVNLIGAGVASFVPEKDEERINFEKRRKEEKRQEKTPPGAINAAITHVTDAVYDTVARYPLATQGSIMLVDNIGANWDAYEIRKRYIQRLKDAHIPLPEKPLDVAENSKEMKEWKKDFHEAYLSTGHLQRLDINLQRIEDELAKVGGRAADIKLKVMDHSVQAVTEGMRGVEEMEKIVGHNDTIKTLLADRKVLIQDLEEVRKYPRGWMLAAAKAGFWTASSAFQTIASKNHPLDAASKYSEICAHVATMAVSVPEEQRDTMVHKSALYLAAQDAIYLPSDQLETMIRDKVTLLQKSRWLDQSPSQPELPATATRGAPVPATPPSSEITSISVSNDGKIAAGAQHSMHA